MKPLLEIKNLKKYYPINKGIFSRNKDFVQALNDVSFVVYENETVGLVGESGSGKSTLGRAILQLEKPDSGQVIFSGKNWNKLNNKELKQERRNVQMVFQDPIDSLNSRFTVGQIIQEPLDIYKTDGARGKRKKVIEIMELVGLNTGWVDRYPHELSGGQRQRIGIARALVLYPRLIIADEPVSALDISMQAQILNLIKDLQSKLKISFIFISHDLNVVRYVSHRVMVMYLGKIVEQGRKDSIYNKASHPYTQFLLKAMPITDPNIKLTSNLLAGEIPSSINPPSGCFFHPRCPIKEEICTEQYPKEFYLEKEHCVCCWKAS